MTDMKRRSLNRATVTSYMRRRGFKRDFDNQNVGIITVYMTRPQPEIG